MAEQQPTVDQEPRPGARIPEAHDFATGPMIGDKLPDFTLPDQYAKTLTFSEARDGEKALVVFIRSARW